MALFCLSSILNKYLNMPINVTEKDKRIEKAVIDKVQDLYEPFKYMKWQHNVDDDLAAFDFYGFQLDTHRISVDVKAIYSDPDEYPSNIFDPAKWDEFIEYQPQRSHYIVYYYPNENYIRIYDLDKSGDSARHGKANIYHKREKQYRLDDVVYIDVNTKDFEIENITITY